MLNEVKMSEVISTFITAVDIVNPVLKFHHRRTAVIAYHLGQAYGLSDPSLARLVVAAAIHDIGALTVKDADTLKTLDVERPQPHCSIGANMLGSYQVFEHIAQIIRHHHVKYVDLPLGANPLVPEESYLLHLADRVDILLTRDEIALNQVDHIRQVILDHNGTLFAPSVVEAFDEMSWKEYFWFDIDGMSMNDLLDLVSIESIAPSHADQSLEELVYTLSRVIDFKCEFTACHSVGVAHVAYRLGQILNLSEETCQELKIAGYLHDIGKIAIPSEIIMKSAGLTQKEFNIMKSHPYYTRQILKHIHGFEKMANWASAHHEKKDMTGYPRKPYESEIGLEVEIMSYADMFTALSENRPYRSSLPLDEVMEIIEREMVEKMGMRVFRALSDHGQGLYRELYEIQLQSEKEYQKALLVDV